MSRRIGPSFFVLLVFCFAAPSFAQARFSESDLSAADAGQKLVAAASSEKKLADAIALLERFAPRLSAGTGKLKAFAALARFLELSGSFSQAAEAWLSASIGESEPRDCRSVLEAARCLIAVGETERAVAEIDSVLRSCSESSLIAGARLLNAYAAAFRRDETVVSSLKALSTDEAYAADRPTILFLLARFFDDQPSRDRLVNEYPSSSEARIISGSGSELAAQPYWLIAADRSAVSVRIEAPAPGKSEEKIAEPSVGPVALQLGLFKEEKNARALVLRLSAKGFSATVGPRTVGGSSYFAVTVEPGASAYETIMRLKNAGFESFPLF